MTRLGPPCIGARPMTASERQKRRMTRLKEAEAELRANRAKEMVDRLVDAAIHFSESQGSCRSEPREELAAAREAVERAIIGGWRK